MKYFAGLIIFFVAAVLVAGILTIGSPAQQRKERFDEQRVNDLMSLQSQLVAYWQSKQELPNDPDQLNDSLRGFVVPVDPESGQEYQYTKTGDTAFRLCASFNRASSIKKGDSFRAKPIMMPYPAGMDGGTWEHGEGIQCFDRTIDPDFFPPAKEIKKENDR
ncbi:hypothetical protein HY732_03140 [Candidatus Uhrbacteria bacterium]|nr:hypothetical protein [Candidatus Uhrbacteria bacterium]